MNKFVTLSLSTALLGTAAMAQTGFPPEIQGQIDRLVSNGFTVTDVRGNPRDAEIEAVGPDGSLYELELDENRWRMERDDEDEDEDEGDDEEGEG